LWRCPCSEGNVLTQTRTWYDHLGRVRMTAECGATGPAGVDRRGLDHDDAWPTAEAILTADPAPISLVENTYNLRGLAEEVRRYQFVEEGEPEVQSTAMRTYYDYAGRSAEVHSPGAPVQRSIYDAKGRQVFALTMVGDDEVTRLQLQPRERGAGPNHRGPTVSISKSAESCEPIGKMRGSRIESMNCCSRSSVLAGEAASMMSEALRTWLRPSR